MMCLAEPPVPCLGMNRANLLLSRMSGVMMKAKESNMRYLTCMMAAILIFGLMLLHIRGAHGARMKVKELDYGATWKAYLNNDTDLEPSKIYPYEHCFRQAAQKYDVPLTLLLALARGESDFNPRAKSPASCYGIMQIQWPGTAGDLGFSSIGELYEPCKNIMAGARYIKMLMDRYNGDVHLAVAAYNYGPGRISREAASGDIPRGANWYSGYVYYHLQQVLKGATPGAAGDIRMPPVSNIKNGSGIKTHVPNKTSKKTETKFKRAAKPEKAQYRPGNKIPVILFHNPLLARNFLNYFEDNAPEVRLDWFRTTLGETYIVLLFDTQKEKTNSIERMKELGYYLDVSQTFL